MLRKPQEKPTAVINRNAASHAAPVYHQPEPAAFGSNELIAVRLRSGFERFDFIVPSIPRDGEQAIHRRLSDVPKLMMKEGCSLPVHKCIYERAACSSRDGGFERMFIESLEADGRISAYCRLYWAHQIFFHLDYEEANGSTAVCHPDFLVRTMHTVYMVETGAPPPLTDPGVQCKLQAAAAWCAQINSLDPALRDGRQWHYVLLLEEAFRSWQKKGAFSSDLLAFSRFRPSKYSFLPHSIGTEQ